ncbi:MAG: CBS domain-containing protein [Gammaproteobacteria bacterium]|nr:CBS domain-containing protein [Gammaproteobacteria bacterium]
MRPLKPIVRVREVMKADLDIVDGMISVSEALNNMKYPETRTLIVDKRHENDEFGVVMFRDIAKRVLAPDLSPERINMYEIMSKPVIGVDPEMDVRYCTKLFDRFGLSRAPVIEDGAIIGLVSYTDIVLKGVMLQDD